MMTDGRVGWQDVRRSPRQKTVTVETNLERSKSGMRHRNAMPMLWVTGCTVGPKRQPVNFRSIARFVPHDNLHAT